MLRPDLPAGIGGVRDVAAAGLRLVNREPGAEARRVLDRELAAAGIEPRSLPGYDTRATGHLEVAAAIAAGLADAGIASEPAALAYGLRFIPLTAGAVRPGRAGRPGRIPRGPGAAAGAVVAVAARSAGQPARLRAVELRRAHRYACRARAGC